MFSADERDARVAEARASEAKAKALQEAMVRARPVVVSALRAALRTMQAGAYDVAAIEQVEAALGLIGGLP